MCKREPTLKHSNSYHRESCDYYSAFNNELYKSDCSECVKAGRLCSKPKNEYYLNFLPPEYFQIGEEDEV
jgi:hypothetical protein